MYKFVRILIAKARGKFKQAGNGFVDVLDHWIESANLESFRVTPSILLDTNNRDDIAQYISVHHKVSSAGDVISQWATRTEDKNIFILWLRISNPVELELFIQFDLFHDFWIIDAIHYSKLVRIRAGETGDDKLSAILRPSVFLEITSQMNDWDSI